jgi:hypothetical protein
VVSESSKRLLEFRKALITAIAISGLCHFVHAAPDEDKLGKGQGYPIGTAKTWFFDESVRVGSFTAQGEIAGIFGETRIRNLLRMASGARYTEEYDGKDDAARFGAAMSRDGIETAAQVITEREAPQGSRFSYGSAQTHTLAAVLRGATEMSVSEYLTPRLWLAIGAETSALWRTDKTGLELAGGHFNATLRDYARLGIYNHA